MVSPWRHWRSAPLGHLERPRPNGKMRPSYGSRLGPIGVVAAGLASTVAHADTIDLYSGDGTTPSFAQLLDQHRPAAPDAGHPVTPGAKGAASYGLSFDLPPAIVQPSLGISYSSSGAFDAELAYGWSLSGPMEMRVAKEQAYADYDAAYHLSGGVSALLLDSGDGLVPHLTGSTQVQVAPDADGFTVWVDDRVFVLEAVGVPDGVDAQRWRATSMSDLLGNTVSYTYNDDGRLTGLHYGGQDIDGDGMNEEPHLVWVQLDYAPTANARVSGRQGYVQWLDEVLTSVTVSTAAVPTVDLVTWELEYADHEGVEVLDKIYRRGLYAGTEEERLVWFDYSVPDDPVGLRTSVDIPSWLRASATTTFFYKEQREQAFTATTAMMLDLNNDGHADAVEADIAGVWTVGMNTGRGFADPGPVVGAPNTPIHETMSWDDDDYEGSAQVIDTQVMTNDLDGDGYPDVLIVNEDTTEVYYGNGAGFDPPVPLAWPAELPALERRNALDIQLLEILGTTEYFHDTDWEVMDVDTDGWLDIVDFRSGGQVIYRHSGVRGAGWVEEDPLEASPGDVPATRTVVWEADEYDELLYSRPVPGLRDMTGDGLPDFVDARGWTDANPYWTVYPGTGNGWPEAEAIDWASPTPYLEVVDEGSPSGWRTVSAPDDDACTAMSQTGRFLACMPADAPHVYQGQQPESPETNPADEPDPGGEGGLPGPDGDTGWGDSYYPDTGGSGSNPFDEGLDDDGGLVVGSEHGCRCQHDGRPTLVEHTLMDVNGDGLPDLVYGTASGTPGWQKNVGTGFEPPRAEGLRGVGTWWLDSLTGSVSEVDDGGYHSTEVIDTLQDLDGDRQLDRLITVDAGADTNTATFSDVTGPYLLVEVKHGPGAITALSYLPSTAYTATDGPAHAPRGWVLSAVQTDEELYGLQSTVTTYDYAGGRSVDGVFEGWELVQRTTTLDDDDPVILDTTYDLDPVFPPLPAHEELWAATGVPGTEADELAARWTVDNGYVDRGSRHLLASVIVTTYGEDPSATPTTTTSSYLWSDDGDLLTYSHDGDGVVEDYTRTDFTYVTDNSGVLRRIARKEVYGTDPFTGDYRLHEVSEYGYDGNLAGDTGYTLTEGLLTDERVASGWHGGGESVDADYLMWGYGRESRGQLKLLTDWVTGETAETTFGFGGAVPTTVTNALGHTSNTLIDPFGRITESTDPNGVTSVTVLDDFGRTVQTRLIDTDGTDHLTSETVYDTGRRTPHTVSSTTYDLGGLDTQSYTVLDGLGRELEHWSLRPEGDFSVTHTIATGSTTTTTHPTFEPAFETDGVASRIAAADTMSRIQYDTLGVPRLSETDVTAGVGTGDHAAYVLLDEPLATVEVDGEGYVKRLVNNALGQLVRVEEGKVDPATGLFVYAQITGLYDYDPSGRLVEFIDGGGTTYHYDYDAIGRLREVRLGNDPATTEFWYGYDYRADRRTHQFDASGAEARWEHDPLGRTTDLHLTDPLLEDPSDRAHYQWVYDTAWIGALAQTIDPVGNEDFTYDSRGLLATGTRTYDDGTVVPMVYDRDLNDRVLSLTLPSGAVVGQRFEAGRLVETTAPAAGPASSIVSIGYTYDAWGGLAGWSTDDGAVFGHTTRTTPSQVGEVAMIAETHQVRRQYTWHHNGLLASKSAPGKFTETYDYDALQQLVGASDARRAETYDYDTAGNLTDMTDANGIPWLYGPAVDRNRVPYRYSPAGGTDTFDYDDAGRMTEVSRTSGVTRYRYDGLGRLREVTDGIGASVAVFDRNATGEIVLRQNGGSVTYDYGGWTSEPAAGRVEEQLTGFLSRVDQGGISKLHWHLQGFDGTSLVAMKTNGGMVGRRRPGPYGQRMAEGGQPRKQAAFHGIREEAEVGLLAAGPRHVNQIDGTWLQPEPLLYLGLPEAGLRSPHGLAPYRYAGNTPTVLADSNGLFFYSLLATLAGCTFEPLAMKGPIGAALSGEPPGDPIATRNAVANAGAQTAATVASVGMAAPGVPIPSAAAANSMISAGTATGRAGALTDDIATSARLVRSGADDASKGGRLGDVVEAADTPLEITARHGLLRSAPKHHIFPQANRDWFSARGVDIDKYTIKITEGDHSALHFGGGPGKGGGWWNEQIMQRLTQRESALGRQLTEREILYEGALLRREAGLQHVNVEPY